MPFRGFDEGSRIPRTLRLVEDVFELDGVIGRAKGLLRSNLVLLALLPVSRRGVGESGDEGRAADVGIRGEYVEEET